MKADRVLEQLETELAHLYEYNTTQFGYQPNPNGTGMRKTNLSWENSTQQKLLYKRITELEQLIKIRKNSV